MDPPWFSEKQVHKEERVALLEKLSASTWKNELLRSSKTLGRKSETRRENLQRAALEEKLGVARSDPSVRLYVSERDPEEVRRQADGMARAVAAPDPAHTEPRRGSRGGKRRLAEAAKASAASSTDLEMAEPDDAPMVAADTVPATAAATGSGLATATITKRKRQKKGRVLEQLGLVAARQQSSSSESDFDSSASESGDEDNDGRVDDSDIKEDATVRQGATETASPPVATAGQPRPLPPAAAAAPMTPYTGSMLKPLLVSRGLVDADESGSGKKAYYVHVERPEHIQCQRMALPVYTEEQQIMEAITESPVVVLSGETGSGKTTQVPQFLFEAGYGDPSSPNPGLIGITQPRRVAAVSMAHRVAEELGNFGRTVAHQVRFDTTVSADTRVKFMTEGVLLRELATDLLLTKYSVIIADEAHERSLNTDILLGVLSRVVRLRQKLALESPDKHRPLKLVIMSATLRVDDFVRNSRLFRTPPPVLSVQARQHPVRVHFNRRTPAPGQHVHDAIQKAAKIHTRLPDGGILIFLTGQAEITYACKRLREMFSPNAGSAAPAQTPANGLVASVEDEDVDIGDVISESGELRDDY
ncbi:putative ATP-dependent RNA helicase DHR1, partial [Coemansia nantahalensis]